MDPAVTTISAVLLVVVEVFALKVVTFTVWLPTPLVGLMFNQEGILLIPQFMLLFKLKLVLLPELEFRPPIKIGTVKVAPDCIMLPETDAPVPLILSVAFLELDEVLVPLAVNVIVELPAPPISGEISSHETSVEAVQAIVEFI